MVSGDSPNGDTDFITAYVRRDVHGRINEIATQKKVALKYFESDILEKGLAKLEFMQRYAPMLEFDTIDNNKIWIRDLSLPNLRTSVPVFMKKKGSKWDAYCEYDSAFDCIHAKYALMCPEIGRLKW